MDRILKFGFIAFLIPFFSEVDFSKILRFVDRTKASVYRNLPVLQYPIVPSWWDVRRPSHLLNSYQTPSEYIRQERHWLCNWLTSMFYLKSRKKKITFELLFMKPIFTLMNLNILKIRFLFFRYDMNKLRFFKQPAHRDKWLNGCKLRIFVNSRTCALGAHSSRYPSVLCAQAKSHADFSRHTVAVKIDILKN